MTTRGAPAEARGEIWLTDLDPTRGHEQSGRRPVVVVSADGFNSGRAGLVVVVPLTTRDRRVPLNVAIEPPEGGVRERSFAMCEMIRSISVERLVGDAPWGSVSDATLHVIDDRLRILLAL